jgi:hypothetical protein
MSVNATTVDTELFHSCARIGFAGGRAGGAVALTTRLRTRGGVFVQDRSGMRPNPDMRTRPDYDRNAAHLDIPANKRTAPKGRPSAKKALFYTLAKAKVLDTFSVSLSIHPSIPAWP